MSASSRSSARPREQRADESASKVLSRAQNTVERSHVALLYGERLALLSHVSAALHTIVAEEEKARRELRNEMEYGVWMDSVMANEGQILERTANTEPQQPVGDVEEPAKASDVEGKGEEEQKKIISPSSEVETPDLKSNENEAPSPPDVEEVGELTITTKVTTTTTTAPNGEITVVVRTEKTITDAEGNVLDVKALEESHLKKEDNVGTVVNGGEHQNDEDEEKSESRAEKEALAASGGSSATETHTSSYSNTYKLSPAVLAILADPANRRKIQTTRRERTIQKMLAATRPSPQAAPRLHYVPPARVSVNRYASSKRQEGGGGFEAPILAAMYGPTSELDAFIEGRPIETIPQMKRLLAESSRRSTQKRSRSSVSNSVTALGERKSPSRLHLVAGSSRASSVLSSPTLTRVGSARAGFPSSSSSPQQSPRGSRRALAGRADRGGLSEVLAKTYSPNEQHRQGPPRVNNEPRALALFPPTSNPSSVQQQSILLVRRIDSANPAARREREALRFIEHPFFPSPSNPRDNNDRSQRQDGVKEQQDSASEGGQADTTTDSPERDESISPPATDFDFGAADNHPHYDAPWYWAEQDTARAVAVMACLVADGLDEIMVRGAIEARRHLGEQLESATDTNSEGEATTPSNENNNDVNGLNSGDNGASAAPTAKQRSETLARALAITLKPTEELTPLDVDAIESAVAAAKKGRIAAKQQHLTRGMDEHETEKEKELRGKQKEEDERRAQEEQEAARRTRIQKAARACRAAINKIAVDEHENCYEIVHDEITQHKAIMVNHKASLAVVRKTTLTGQQHERMILERRSTLELLKIVLLWQSQHEQIMELYWGRRAVLQRVAEGRRALEASETTARGIIAEYGLVLSRQLLREAAEDAAKLKPLQTKFSSEKAAELKKAQEARQYEAALAERERLIRDHQEVERLLRQKEAVRKAQREQQWAMDAKASDEDFPFQN